MKMSTVQAYSANNLKINTKGVSQKKKLKEMSSSLSKHQSSLPKSTPAKG
jgi:hypothetical protein